MFITNPLTAFLTEMYHFIQSSLTTVISAKDLKVYIVNRVYHKENALILEISHHNNLCLYHEVSLTLIFHRFSRYPLAQDSCDQQQH